MKALIYVGLFGGSTLFGWLGSLLASGNWLSWQSLLGSTIGAFVGIYAGYKLSQWI